MTPPAAITNRLLNVREAAEFLGIAPGSLYHWVSQGRIPCVRFSARCLRFRLLDLEEWIEDLMKHSDGRVDCSRNANLVPCPSGRVQRPQADWREPEKTQGLSARCRK